MDGFFGKIALRRGYVSPQVLLECVQEQQAQFRRSETPLRLGQILLKRKAITVEQFLEILRDQKKSILCCPGCRSIFDVGERTVEANIVCLHCGEGVSLEPKSTQETPRTVGRFRILREIGHGGMGIIYEAEDPDAGRKVALKVLRGTTARKDEIQRFRREATLSGQMSHPNVIRIHEVGMVREGNSETPLHYLAMDYVEGGTLESELPRLDLRERVRILEKVAFALGYAHRRGIVHRDLKPANILLDRRKEPILTDFGLAQGTTSVRITVSGEILGTPCYMAPEQVDGRRRLDARTDVWALGVILYELLTDRSPFEGRSSALLFDTIRRQDPLPPKFWVKEIPPDLEAVCLKALSKDSMDRYGDGQTFAEELRRWREGRPVRARPESRSRLVIRLWKWIPRKWLLMAACCLLGILGSTAGWALLRPASDPNLAEEVRRTHELVQAVQVAGENDARLRVQLDRLSRKLDEPGNATSAEGWRVLGIGWWMIGEPKAALSALQRAKALAPGDGVTSALLARLSRGSRD